MGTKQWEMDVHLINSTGSTTSRSSTIKQKWIVCTRWHHDRCTRIHTLSNIWRAEIPIRRQLGCILIMPSIHPMQLWVLNVNVVHWAADAKISGKSGRVSDWRSWTVDGNVQKSHLKLCFFCVGGIVFVVLPVMRKDLLHGFLALYSCCRQS